LAKYANPTIKGITSHHLVSADKVDVGTKFPWAKLFKTIKDKTTAQGTPWEPIFGDKFYDDSGKMVGELVRDLNDQNLVDKLSTLSSKFSHTL
jgi:N-acetyl-anhydromuramyl-L-alanine amidase AmpD